MASLHLIEAENERYAATLVFLHGLWAAPEIWRGMALGFAHRGWRSAVADSRATAPGRPSFSEWCDDVAGAIAKLGMPAVVIGHDAGGLVALALAARGQVAASVAVAPLLEGAGGLVDPVTRLRSRFGIGPVEPPPRGHPYRHASSEAAVSILDQALVVEPAARVGSLRGMALAPGAPSAPTLLVAQASDPIVSVPLVEVTASGIDADSMTLPGTHWPMLEPRPDAWMSPVHRWLVRRLGPEILLLRGDEDLVEE